MDHSVCYYIGSWMTFNMYIVLTVLTEYDGQEMFIDILKRYVVGSKIGKKRLDVGEDIRAAAADDQIKMEL